MPQGNRAYMPTQNNMVGMTSFGGGSAPPMGGGSSQLPYAPAPVAAQSGAASPGFITAAPGTVAPYSPSQGESGFTDQFQQDAFGRFTTSPDYQFRFNEGQRALDSSAAARGTLMSGRQLQELTNFGQNLASQEYGNYMNRLFGVAGLAPSGGQNLAAQGGMQGFNNMFNAAGSLGTNLGNIAGAQGQNTANIWGSALGNIDFGGLASGIGGMFGNNNSASKYNGFAGGSLGSSVPNLGF
jgi:hypothetical protein